MTQDTAIRRRSSESAVGRTSPRVTRIVLPRTEGAAAQNGGRELRLAATSWARHAVAWQMWHRPRSARPHSREV